MALGKKRVSNMSSKMDGQSENVICHHVLSGRHLVFPKIAVYFKLNYFELTHLQAIMLSSFIFTYSAVNLLIFHKIVIGAKNTRLRT